MASIEDSGMIPNSPQNPSSGPLPREAVNPAALTPDQLAHLLGVGVETIRRHAAMGAPVSVEGRMNLVHYAAWLNRQLGKTDAD